MSTSAREIASSVRGARHPLRASTSRLYVQDTRVCAPLSRDLPTSDYRASPSAVVLGTLLRTRPHEPQIDTPFALGILRDEPLDWTKHADLEEDSEQILETPSGKYAEYRWCNLVPYVRCTLGASTPANQATGGDEYGPLGPQAMGAVVCIRSER